jgi:hypothetical protein
MTIVRNTKIPHNPRILKGQKNHRAADVVVPSVKGLRTIRPSVLGIAERAELIRSGITMIQTARAVAMKTGDTELAALANSPRLKKALDTSIKRLSRDADSILRAQLATSNDNPEDLVRLLGTGPVNTPHNSYDPSTISGTDAAQVARIQNARFSTAQDVAEARGALNPARVAAGLGDEVPDDVYAFMGDLSKRTSK